MANAHPLHHSGAVPRGTGLKHGLHGRAAESIQLKRAVHRVLTPAQEGERRPELILISGESGTGKSSLARSLKDDICKAGGIFLEGKFDQFQQSHAIAAAFEQYVSTVATGSDKMKLRIKDAVGSDAKLLAEMVPGIGSLLGLAKQQANTSQPTESPSFTSSSDTTKARATRTLCKFAGAICSFSNPVIMLLDDLQWSDATSFDVLGELLRDNRIEGLVLLCACRSVPHDHELSIFLRSLNNDQPANIQINDILVTNVSEETMAKFLSDLLHVPEEECQTLAKLVHVQTGGNFFFAKQFVQSLQEDQLLVYNKSENCSRGGWWKWSEEEVTSRYSCHDVLQFMTCKLRLLPREMQDLLRFASCLGTTFQESILCVLHDTTVDEVNEFLIVCQEKDLVSMISLSESQRTWKFTHDGIQQAAFCLIPDNEAIAFHLAIGRKLRDHLNVNELDTNILLVASQLRIGCVQMKSQRERAETAMFFLRAGQRASVVSRFQEAGSYLQSGMNLLGENHWKSHYGLSLDLYNAGAEIAYITADFDRLDDLTTTVIAEAKSFDDRLQSYTTHVFSLGSRNLLQEAVSEGLMVLEKLGEPLPRSVTKTLLAVEFYRTRIALSRLTRVGLLDLNSMKNQKKLATMRLMNLLYSYTFWRGDAMAAIITYRSLQMTMKYGLSGMSAVGLAFYAGCICSFGNIDQGYRLGEIALIVIDRFNATEWKGRVLTILCSFVFPWKDPPRQMMSPLWTAYQSGLDSGDIEFALIAKGVSISNQLVSGCELQETYSRWCSFYDELHKFKQDAVMFLFVPGMQATLNLLSKPQDIANSEDPLVLTGRFMNEQETLDEGEKAGNYLAVCLTLLFKSLIAIVMNEHGIAKETVLLLERQPKERMSPFMAEIELYIVGLVRLAEDRPKLREVKRLIRKLQKHVMYSPKTALSKMYLLEAEALSASGKVALAVAKYESAIGVAQRESFLFEEAIACERAYFCMSKFGDNDEAACYLMQAKDAYRRWGCSMKGQQLNEIRTKEREIPSWDVSI